MSPSTALPSTHSINSGSGSPTGLPAQSHALFSSSQQRSYPVCFNLRTENREVAALKFNRITINPRQMGGVPCIRGLRIPAATVVGMVADGMTTEEILRSFPDLERDDIRESLQYAAEALRERELPLAVGS